MPPEPPAEPLLDILPDGVLIADRDGVVTHANDIATMLLGIENPIGRQLSEVLLLQDLDGHDWYGVTDPYDGLNIRRMQAEQAWRLPDGTELLVTTRMLRRSPHHPVDHVTVSLRSARARRETYVGPWIPEPIVEDPREDPSARAELADSLSLAFLVVLERLTPVERAAFLLREVFASDCAEIARVLGRSEAAARQTVHRARERVRADRARFVAPPDAAARLFTSFVEALERDDKEAMLAVLAADAEWTSDGGGKASAARRVVRGADRIVRMLLGIEAKYGHPFTYRMASLNGETAVVHYLGDRVFAATFCQSDGERNMRTSMSGSEWRSS